MATFVYGSPYAPPDPPYRRLGVTASWTGWDGSVWDMSPSAGVFLMPGVRGLTMPPVDHYIDTPAGIDGGRWRGSRTNVREVYWPLAVWQDGSDLDWLAFDAAFWRTMDPTKPGTWTITGPDGQERTLKCRFINDGDKAWDTAPGMRSWTPYQITLQAEQPYWCGTEVAQTFVTAVSDHDFFPDSGTDLLYISSGAPDLASAAVTNPGDVAAWPVWWVSGRTTATVGVAGRSVDVPFEVDGDHVLVVDTTPTARTAVMVDALTTEGASEAEFVAFVTAQLAAGTGTDRTADLGSATAFAELPAGEAVALAITSTGDDPGWVRVAFTPRYWRAW